MIASVEIGSGDPQAKVPLLPLTAFVQGPGGKESFGVLVVEGDVGEARVKRREVDLGNVVGNRVAVVGGLTAGERVVTVGASMVVDGERVEVLPEEKP
jgi:multidrug efflux pump subunit AcrA (membrane-fusion protein)